MSLSIRGSVFFSFAILFVILGMPFLALAQGTDLRSEIRSSLLNAEGSENLSDEYFEVLVESLAQAAEAESIQAGEIASSQAEALFVENPRVEEVVFEGSKNFDRGSVIGIVAFLAIAWFLLKLWRRMHHGGALGHYV